MLPLGPVIVFGASNFPFAYSTGGGDTASAFAAGCTVVVKGHPAHVQTSLRMAEIISIAVKECGFPDDIFQHVHGSSFDTGKMLVRHGRTKAVGFTGSVSGGTALFQWANQREIPIPVFAEMGSVNPVFIFPQKLLADSASVAKMIASSITLGLGQFCTKPGLIFLLNNDHSKNFISILANEVGKVPPGKMLHEGIATSYKQKSAAGMGQPGVEVIYSGGSSEGSVAIASVTAKKFLNNPLLHEEVFGPFSLVVKCESVDEMNVAAKKLHGQLTATVIASDQEINDHGDLLVSLKDVCGRMIFNGVPTGVEVALSMHHGGPFPATTDSRFTAVGADAIRRFARPICFQNCPGDILPDELKNENPLGFWRTINNELTRDPVD